MHVDKDTAATLLDRNVDCDPVSLIRQMAGKRICVTGAGGSIGSRISELLAEHHTGQILLLDRHDGNLFNLSGRLSERVHKFEMKLCDVTDETEIFPAIIWFRPDYVIHTAAYKHVAMLQNQYAAAYKNNVQGTLNVTRALASTQRGRMVLISTDKAVNPSSIMGETKRQAEKVVLERNDIETAVVRFGNVLGSSGSVYELWHSAHAAGRSIRVTGGNHRRYFMTEDEAATLVFAACIHPQSGMIHIPNVGDDVAIKDLADRFLSLSGGGSMGFGPPASGEKTSELLYVNGETVVVHDRSTGEVTTRTN